VFKVDLSSKKGLAQLDNSISAGTMLNSADMSMQKLNMGVKIKTKILFLMRPLIELNIFICPKNYRL